MCSKSYYLITYFLFDSILILHTKRGLLNHTKTVCWYKKCYWSCKSYHYIIETIRKLVH